MDDSRSATLREEKSSPAASLSEEKQQAHAVETDKEMEAPAEYYKPSSVKGAEDEDPVEAANNALARARTSEEGVEYPKGAKLGLISLALCLAVFLIALDNTIIATAIPKITDHFNSLADVGWYGSAYLLTTAAFQLLFGKFYTFFSIKWVFLIAIGIFELGSLLCGVAPSSTALIVGRAIAGLGSAGIFSGALIIVAYSVPLQQRPMYSGFIGAMYGIASVAGPLLGGVFTDKATWRWCFYINLPIGAITIAVIAIFFKAPDRKAVTTLTWRERIGQLDLLGTAFFMPAIICLLLGLQWGGSKYAFNSGRIIALFVLFGVLIVAFLYIQYRQDEKATVPPRIIKQRSIAAAAWFSFCLGSAFFILVYYIPVWFQAVQGVSAVQSGIRSLPIVLGLVIISVVAGIGVSIEGHYSPWMIASSVVMSIGTGLITTFKPDTGKSMWIGYQAIAGIGVGLGMQQPLMTVQTVLDIKDVPTGTSVIIFIQTLGGALFVSIAQNIFTNKLKDGLAEFVPSLDSSIVLSTGATDIQTQIPKEFLEGVTLAYNNALVRAFTVSLAMACLSILGSVLVEFRSVKGNKPATDDVEVAAEKIEE